MVRPDTGVPGICGACRRLAWWGWGEDKHMGKDQRLLGSAAAGLNLIIGIWQVYLQGVLDSPGSGMG